MSTDFFVPWPGETPPATRVLPAFNIQPATWKAHRRPRTQFCPPRLPRRPALPPRQRLAMTSSLPATVDARVTTALAQRNVVVTGATGLIGRALVRELRASQANVSVLARSPSAAHAQLAAPPGTVSVLGYNAETPALSREVHAALARADVVINLAGEPVDAGRWTPERKQVLWDSRVRGTGKLVDALRANASDAVFLSASAVGYYGTSETKFFTEDCGPGTDFLATLASAWEQAALRNAGGSRTVVLRIGVVLGNGGGALEKMSRAFKVYLGGPPGSGTQWFSWVHLDDVVRLILHACVDTKWEGVYNATAPQPVRLGKFCEELGRVLGRPNWLPVPRKAVQALLGNEAAELILAGQQVLPQRTRANGFIYKYKDVASALQQLTKVRESEVSNLK